MRDLAPNGTATENHRFLYRILQYYRSLWRKRVLSILFSTVRDVLFLSCETAWPTFPTLKRHEIRDGVGTTTIYIYIYMVIVSGGFILTKEWWWFSNIPLECWTAVASPFVTHFLCISRRLGGTCCICYLFWSCWTRHLWLTSLLSTAKSDSIFLHTASKPVSIFTRLW